MDIEKLLDQLTIEEKCQLLVGKDSWHTMNIDRLGIPSIMMADGPHGLRKQLDSGNSMMVNESYKAVCFPPAVTVASSFDPSVAYKMGSAIADECLYKDVHVLLGPGINIKRSPLCGRNFEYYSEDPYVSGEMAKGFINGLQSKGVGACVKHFALNSQETYRMISNSIADKRAFYEIYSKAFKIALETNPSMVMCSYNKVDGTYASENPWLLNQVLRQEFGFNGVIVSDWTAVNDRTKALKATLDLEMPGHDYAVKKLLHDYRENRLSIDEINAGCKRILELVKAKKDQRIVTFDLEKNHHIAYEIAKESMVLLKNKDSILPLRSQDNIAIIGQLAKTVRYQGGGSSHINAYKVDSVLDKMPTNVQYEYADGYELTGDGYNQTLIDEAKKIVINKDKVILFLGLTDEYESEGYDREHLNLPLGHLELLKAVSQLTDNIVVVLEIGSPIIMPWIDQVKGILNAYLAGEAGARAIVELLYGLANPSGRLAETFPLNIESNPSHDYYAKGNGDVPYQESIYVGYRYYTSAEQSVLFPFGYGLSYSSFSYSNLTLEGLTCNHPGKFKVTVDVKNTGFWVGKEVVQLYVSAPQKGVFSPLRELKAFQKIELQPNETQTVTFILSTDELGYYDLAEKGIIVQDGFYTVQINRNAEEVILEKAIRIENPNAPKSDERMLSAKSYTIEGGLTFKRSDFENLIDQNIGEYHFNKTRPFDLNNTIEDIKKTFIGRIIYRMARKEAFKSMNNMGATERMMVEKSLGETPIRAMVVFSGGMLKMKTMLGVLDLINHHPLQAIKHFIGRF